MRRHASCRDRPARLPAPGARRTAAARLRRRRSGPTPSPTRPTARSTPTARNAILVCHALTGDQYVAEPHPVTGKPGWWDTLVGPGKVLDTDRYFLICANVLGGCMGSTGPSEINPATGKAVGPALPGHHHRRHGARAEAADRPSRHRAAVLRHRRLDGRDAGAAMGGGISRARLRRGADRRARRAIRRRTSPSTRSAARRSWPIPNWCGGDYLERRHAARARPRRGAHGGAHHLSLGAGAAPQVRPQPAGPRRRHLRLRRRFPGRELSAPPGHHLRRPVRRQLLSLHHPRLRLFRSRGRAWRRARQRLPPARATRFCVISFTSDWLYPDEREPRDRPRA